MRQRYLWDNSKQKEYRLLILSQSASPVSLIKNEMTRSKIPFVFKQISTLEELKIELKQFLPDVILSDYQLPKFTATDSLHFLQNQKTDVPFILVTGSLSDEVAVECMKEGAHDCVLLSSIRRLPGAVLNAVDQRETAWRQEQAEAELHQREEQYRLITSNMQDLIYILDKRGNFTYICPSVTKVLGYPEEKLLGHKLFSFLHPEDKSTIQKTFQESLTAKEGRTERFRYKHFLGQWIYFESVVSWIFDDKGNPQKAVVVSRDITERKRLEEQLHQAQKMEAVGRLASGVAHDFNNLLTAITGYSDLLCRSLDRMDPRREEVEQIKETVYRGTALTGQLLAFSRKQMLQLKIVDINHIIVNMERMLNRLIGDDIQLVTNLDPEICPLRADTSQIEQVLLNLCVNSRDAMLKGGQIIIETQNIDVTHENTSKNHNIPVGNYIRLVISDTGTGMNNEALAHIFEPFFTTKEQARGTGLGLSTVYGIVTQSSGHIRAESEMGKGTTFYIYFPEASDYEKPNFSPVSSDTAEFFKGGQNILLVEDDEAVRGITSRILTMNGYNVCEARNGTDALKQVLNFKDPLDMLVTDVVMLGMSGPELAKELISVYPKMRILYLSGYTESEMENHMKNGIKAAFLGKPFRPRDLIQKIHEISDVHEKTDTVKSEGKTHAGQGSA